MKFSTGYGGSHNTLRNFRGVGMIFFSSGKWKFQGGRGYGYFLELNVINTDHLREVQLYLFIYIFIYRFVQCTGERTKRIRSPLLGSPT